MLRMSLFALVLLAASVTGSELTARPQQPVTSPAAQPHIVFIMADDFGWANFGVHAKGQPNQDEVQTPRLDALVESGILLERHYVFQFCSPSRCALTTGRNPIHVNLLNDALGNYNLSNPISGFSGAGVCGLIMLEVAAVRLFFSCATLRYPEEYDWHR
jgi:hypothetical protein